MAKIVSNTPLIIGITGAFGSGKSTASSFLSKKGFQDIALSSFLEEEAHRRGIAHITRKILQDIGNEWRNLYGKGILAQKALEAVGNGQAVVIDGIRNVGEVEVLRKHDTFLLLAIVSDREKRFERLKGLKRREDLTWDVFTQLDYRDLGIEQEKKGLQVASCIALADRFIENNGTTEDFIKRLERFVEETQESN